MEFITVKKAALLLGVSTRRVRALLSQGRIRGYKSLSEVHGGTVHRSQWTIAWPLDVLPGKRGPDLRRFPVRVAYAPSKPPKASGKGVVLPFARKNVSRGHKTNSA